MNCLLQNKLKPIWFFLIKLFWVIYLQSFINISQSAQNIWGSAVSSCIYMNICLYVHICECVSFIHIGASFILCIWNVYFMQILIWCRFLGQCSNNLREGAHEYAPWKNTFTVFIWKIRRLCCSLRVIHLPVLVASEKASASLREYTSIDIVEIYKMYRFLFIK